MKFYLSILSLASILATSLALANQQVLRSSFYQQNIEPQIFLDDKGRPISGILFDISHAIANRLAMKLEMVPIPRKRIEQSLVKNIIDMNCAANPKWFKSKALQWSSRIYNNPDILINRLGMTALTDLAEYNEIKIGTTLGYVYPELTIYIENKNVRPITSPSTLESYQKYRKNKMLGFISASIESSYFMKDMQSSVIHMNNNFLYCVLAPDLKKSKVEQINTAIEYLKASGEIDAILSKYKNNPKSVIHQQEKIID